MISKKLVSTVLWATIEDYVVIWEVEWELNSVLNKEGNREIARTILIYLLETDMVKFYFSKWGREDVKEIPRDEAPKYIYNDKYWETVYIGEDCIKVGSTKKGEDYYNNDKLNDLKIDSE